VQTPLPRVTPRAHPVATVRGQGLDARRHSVHLG
jgi:hypothetical protein